MSYKKSYFIENSPLFIKWIIEYQAPNFIHLYPNKNLNEFTLEDVKDLISYSNNPYWYTHEYYLKPKTIKQIESKQIRAYYEEISDDESLF